MGPANDKPPRDSSSQGGKLKYPYRDRSLPKPLRALGKTRGKRRKVVPVQPQTPALVKAWITKYAIDIGIYQVEGVIDPSDSRKLVVTLGATSEHYLRPHWHLKQEAAVEKANAMLDRLIDAAERKLGILKSKRFYVIG